MSNIINDEVLRYVNSSFEPFDSFMGELRDKCVQDRIPLILEDTEMFLRILVKIIKPRRVLEIGTAYGYSAIMFAKLLPDSNITSIELSDENFAIASEKLKASCLNNIELIRGDATTVLEKQEPDSKQFDFVFIDAAKSHYQEYFTKSLPLCQSGAVFVCDNVLIKAAVACESKYDPSHKFRTSIKRMRQFLDFVQNNSELDSSLLTIGDGILLIKYNGKSN